MPESQDFFGYRDELFTGTWPPAVRSAVGAVGVLSIWSALRARGVARALLLSFGFASVTRALANRYVTQLVGLAANPVLRMRRQVLIDASVDDVYAFLSEFSNYPRFMSYVEEVRVNEIGGLHWVMTGPAGTRIAWDATVGALLPGQLIAWQSIPGAVIKHGGWFRITESPGGETRVSVELSFAPPAGALGYAFVHLMGFDPRSRIDSDLARLKHLIENEAPSARELGDFHRA